MPNAPGWPNFPWRESPYKDQWYDTSTVLFEWMFSDDDSGELAVLRRVLQDDLDTAVSQQPGDGERGAVQ